MQVDSFLFHQVKIIPGAVTLRRLLLDVTLLARRVVLVLLAAFTAGEIG